MHARSRFVWRINRVAQRRAWVDKAMTAPDAAANRSSVTPIKAFMDSGYAAVNHGKVFDSAQHLYI
jgi:hypothetical protein